MNDIKTLADVERVLSDHGYTPNLNECSVTLPIGSEESPFPCVIVMDDTYLSVVCEIDTYGNMMGRLDAECREDFLKAMLDMNSQMNSYAFTLMTDIDDPNAGENEDDWPVSLFNSIPVGDISDGELLESIRGLQSALITAKSLFTVSV